MKQQVVTYIVNQLMIHGKIDFLPVKKEINNRLSAIKFINCPECDSNNIKIDADLGMIYWRGTNGESLDLGIHHKIICNDCGEEIFDGSNTRMDEILMKWGVK